MALDISQWFSHFWCPFLRQIRPVPECNTSLKSHPVFPCVKEPGAAVIGGKWTLMSGWVQLMEVLGFVWLQQSYRGSRVIYSILISCSPIVTLWRRLVFILFYAVCSVFFKAIRINTKEYTRLFCEYLQQLLCSRIRNVTQVCHHHQLCHHKKWHSYNNCGDEHVYTKTPPVSNFWKLTHFHEAGNRLAHTDVKHGWRRAERNPTMFCNSFKPVVWNEWLNPSSLSTLTRQHQLHSDTWKKRPGLNPAQTQLHHLCALVLLTVHWSEHH